MDKNSDVYKHLDKPQRCMALSNNDCFTIIDYAKTQHSLSIKGAMHIGWQKSALNKHDFNIKRNIDFLACSICV